MTWPAWTPPNPPDPASAGSGPGGYEVTTDPRVTPTHAVGPGVPCIANPPAPDGWAYWTTQTVTPNLQAFANTVEGNPTTYPMGSFVQAIIDGQLVGARVEWHNLQGATNTSGCFRGTNLMVPLAAGSNGGVAPPQSTDWGLVLGSGLVLAAVVGGFFLAIRTAGRAAHEEAHALENPPWYDGWATRKSGTCRGPVGGRRAVHHPFCTPRTPKCPWRPVICWGPSREQHDPRCRLGRPLCRWRRRERGVCSCNSYSFPHRAGSGACRFGVPYKLLTPEFRRQLEGPSPDDVPF